MFQNGNLYHFLNSKKQDTAYSKNTYYRFLNEARYNWSRFITLLATKVTGYFNSLTCPDRVISLILDDSVIARQRSKKVELLSYVYNHVINRTVKGFNLLTLGWPDGYSFVPVGFNMMASADEKNESCQCVIRLINGKMVTKPVRRQS
ncbi:MAG: transposase [Lachnospiraceae bacterium]